MKLKYLACSVLAMGALLATSCSSKSSEKASDTTVVDMEELDDEYPAAPTADERAAEVMAPYLKEAGDSTLTTTDSGLKYVVLKEGTGKSPAATDMVEVHYTGKLLNGTVFDSSVERGQTATFPLDRVIAGWTEGLQLMKEGGKTVFYIPSNLAYGEQGAPGAIPPNSDLVFEVELIKVNP